MKSNTILLLGTALIGLLPAGCETPYGDPDRTATGALTGGAIGLASGALLGGRHHAAEGALIGGAIGAVTGGLIGHSLDEEHRARLRQQAPETYVKVDQGQPLSVADVKALASAGVGDDVITSQIRNSKTIFRLSSADIIDLKNAGVSEKIIEYMINTPTTNAAGNTAPTAPVYVAAAPPAPPVETVIVSPGPGYVWVDGEWYWNGRWVWVGGRWALPPRGRVVWVGSHWEHGPHGYFRVSGHWR